MVHRPPPFWCELERAALSTVEREDEAAAPQAYGTADDGAQTTDIVTETLFPQSQRPTASRDSRSAARELWDSSGRRQDTPVRKSFVRPMTTASDPVAPLSRIYAGGRSGVVAVKLYLALLWRCSAPPFSTEKPARAWATLLDLEDPETRGARRVKDAMKTLADAGLVTLTENPGFPNTVTLLDEGGDGLGYSLPSTSYTFKSKIKANKDSLASDVYFKVPGRLWTRGYIQSLNGPGLVMLLILLAEQAGEGEEVWFSTSEFPARYNVSHKTRAAGTKELIDFGLLDVASRSLSSKSRPTTFDTQRRRKVYSLTPRAQSAARDEARARAAAREEERAAQASGKPKPKRKLRRRPSPRLGDR